MPDVAVLGVFVADTAYRAARPPRLGETVLGDSFALGPGGKGSNQAVAAARAGASTAMLTRLAPDAFGALARATWEGAGVTAEVIEAEGYTGAAYIFVESGTGQNAIIVAPGVAGDIAEADVAHWAPVIRAARVFVTQLEQPLPAALAALRTAREAGVLTILNPAPAPPLPPGMLALCDWVTPNETEAEALTGIAVADPASAERAARALAGQGAGTVVVTLGANGALLLHGGEATHVPAMRAGPVAETTGAGDAFTGGLAAALAEGRAPLDAVRFATATAAISVTRPGTAPSMPARAEIDALLARG